MLRPQVRDILLAALLCCSGFFACPAHADDTTTTTDQDAPEAAPTPDEFQDDKNLGQGSGTYGQDSCQSESCNIGWNGVWRYPDKSPQAPEPDETPVPFCGDHHCNTDCNENSTNCPADCGFCGDGECWESMENLENCPQDCKYCGDHKCTPGETNESCPEDCSKCGDGICDCLSENSTTCPKDCSTCGDGTCSPNENKTTCPADCSVCGDGTCSAGENCPQDCHECGNKKCEPDGGETLSSCPQDCTVCGDGTCSAGETTENCPKDCGQPTPTPTPQPTPTPAPTPPHMQCPPDKPLKCNEALGICACGRCTDDKFHPACLGCFSPETRIKMADGSVKSIASIKSGDSVWNPVTRQAMRVKYPTMGPEAIPMWQIGFADKAIVVTEGHPIVINNAALESEWSHLSGMFSRTALRSPSAKVELPRDYQVKQARNLKAGDMVYSADGQFHRLTVLRKLPVKNGQQVMNLMLDTDSTRPEDHMVVADGIITGDLYLQEQLKK